MKLTYLVTAAMLSATTLMTPVQSFAKEWTEVTIALEGAYAPWNLTTADGKIDGFEPELSAVLCAHAKLKCTLIAQDWDGMIEALNVGKFDVMMDAVSITDERKKVIAFSAPYASTPAVFATVKDGPLGTLAGAGSVLKLAGKPEDKSQVEELRKALTGKTIGIQTATVYSTFVYDNFKDVATIKEYKTSAERDLDLTAGRIDAGFDDATYFGGALASPDNASLGTTGPEIAGPIWGEGEGLGLRQGDPELKALFDDAIAAAIADGTVKKLSEKWLKIDVTPR
jgi:octopine/nopaline transport system substrate-binding protein